MKQELAFGILFYTPEKGIDMYAGGNTSSILFYESNLTMKSFIPFLKLNRHLSLMALLFICSTGYAQVNDLCGNAVALTSAVSCTNTAGTLTGSTYTLVAGACGTSAGNRNDVWYSFVAQTTNPTVTLSSAPAQARIQVYSGGCGSPSSVGCSAGITYTVKTSQLPYNSKLEKSGVF